MMHTFANLTSSPSKLLHFGFLGKAMVRHSYQWDMDDIARRHGKDEQKC